MADEYYKKVFSNNLRYYMSIKGKSQIDIINDLGYDKSAVSTWFNGSRLPRMDKVDALARYLDIRRSDLIEERTPTASSPAAPAAPVLTPHETDLILSYREAEPWVQMSVDKLLGIEDEVEKKEKKEGIA